MRQFLKTHKKEIIIGIMGIVGGGLLTFIIGIYTINKNFELEQKRELTKTLQADLYLLKKISRELDLNVQLLSSQNFLPDVKFAKVRYPFAKIRNSVAPEEEKKIIEMIWEPFMGAIFANKFNVIVNNIPSELFITWSWHYTYKLENTEIEINLLLELNELYRKLDMINQSIIKVRELTNYIDSINASTVGNIKTHYNVIKKIMTEIKQSKFIEINNRVKDEIRRLDDKLKDNNI